MQIRLDADLMPQLALRYGDAAKSNHRRTKADDGSECRPIHTVADFLGLVDLPIRRRKLPRGEKNRPAPGLSVLRHSCRGPLGGMNGEQPATTFVAARRRRNARDLDNLGVRQWTRAQMTRAPLHEVEKRLADEIRVQRNAVLKEIARRRRHFVRLCLFNDAAAQSQESLRRDVEKRADPWPDHWRSY